MNYKNSFVSFYDVPLNSSFFLPITFFKLSGENTSFSHEYYPNLALFHIWCKNLANYIVISLLTDAIGFYGLSSSLKSW